MELIIATRNTNKIKEIKHLLQDTSVQLLDLAGGRWVVPEIIEDGSTFEENAVKKAVIIAGITGKLTLADDSGLEVDALGGQPGVRSARFAGDKVAGRDLANNLKLLTMLQGAPPGKRMAQFRCVMALVQPDGRTRVVTGMCTGRIGLTEKGNQGFGYDPLFIPGEYDKTFAELGVYVKNKISHRARALEKIKIILEKIAINEKYPRTGRSGGTG